MWVCVWGAQRPAGARKGPLTLTVVALVEDDELEPVQLRHQGEQDVVDAHWRTRGQGVALPVGAGVELAGGAGRPVSVPLDEEVRDVHGIRQRLQRAGRGAAGGRDQSQDPLVHQLAGCRDGGEEEEEGERRRAAGTWPASPSTSFKAGWSHSL